MFSYIFSSFAYGISFNCCLSFLTASTILLPFQFLALPIVLGESRLSLFFSSSSKSCIYFLFCGEMTTPLILSRSLAIDNQSRIPAIRFQQFFASFSRVSISVSLNFFISLKLKYSLSSASILALHFSSILRIYFLMAFISFSILMNWQSGLSYCLGTDVLDNSFMLWYLPTSRSTQWMVCFNSLFFALVFLYSSRVEAVRLLMGLWNSSPCYFYCFFLLKVSFSLISLSSSRFKQVTWFSQFLISSYLWSAILVFMAFISFFSLTIVLICSSCSCLYF